MPPSITASKIYRCADNKVVYVDWLSDKKTANVRTEQGGSPTQVIARRGRQADDRPPAAIRSNGAAGAAIAKIAVPGHPRKAARPSRPIHRDWSAGFTPAPLPLDPARAWTSSKRPLSPPKPSPSMGLAPDEYERILKALGREPNLLELGIFSVMWSEHCSLQIARAFT